MKLEVRQWHETEREVRVHCEASRALAGDMDVRGARCLAEWLLPLAIETAQ